MRFQPLACGTLPAGSHRMRLPRIAAVALTTVVAAATGCGAFGDGAAAQEDGDSLDPAATEPECALDSDCIAAASSCCDCPAFALPSSSRWDDSCEDVLCPISDDCGVAAVCRAGTCVLACEPVTCDEVCERGFVVGVSGCLVCECGSAPTSECSIDADCVEVPADCCGCARGGYDTALPAAAAADFSASLECGNEAACPEVNVCDPTATARCADGYCALVAAPPTQPPDGGATPPVELILCGTTEYPPCPDGYDCILNDPAANDMGVVGVGVCVAQ